MSNLQPEEVQTSYPLATKPGILGLFAILLQNGDMCPKCGYGTRVINKRWNKCKRCGEKVARPEIDNNKPM
jgi:hypothetical protein